ncbi:MAG: hypothetical protein ACRD2Z_03405 [Thermoanaerobaculia bacterium]
MSALAVLLMAAGCVEHETVIKLRPDGSGEIVETTIARGEMVEAMKGMKPEGAEAENDGRAKAEARAATIGAGVSLVSWEELTEGGLGERTVYAFEDINRISVGQGPDSEGGPSGGDRVSFRFTRDGGVSRLVTVFPKPAAAPEQAAPAPGGSEGSTEAPAEDAAAMGEAMGEAMGQGMAEMMKPFLEGFKTRLVVEVVGDVVETDAPAVNGSAVTLMAFDFDQVLATEGAWDKITALGDEQNLVVVGQALEGVPGVDVPSASEVTVSFRGR